MRHTKNWVVNYCHLLGLAFLRTVRKPFKLDHFYDLERAKHIRQTDLFDAEYYLASNEDVAKRGLDPLLHYVQYGDRENRKPSPLFDPGYYRQRAKHCKFVEINSLLHYVAVGRHLKISPSTWFDKNYYLLNNRDVKLNKSSALLHYIKYGGFEGRLPHPLFDSQFYLDNNSDVRASGLNPLIHYVLYGQAEGRPTNPSGVAPETTQAVLAGEDENFTIDDIEPPVKSSQTPLVDVIIPIYEDRLLTLKCLASVLQAQNVTPFEVIAIDDCAPDPALTRDLAELAKRGWITLISHRTNEGFIKSVNTGLALHTERDVVILNSDTEVYDFWLDRLRAAAYSRANVATVTPLSNNGTICSYPRVLSDNPFPLEISYAELDRLAATLNEGNYVESPTGVGFCMFMRRFVIERLGAFDQEAFGQGYGEENDWCQRAIKKGYVNLLAPNIFVKHFGSASFKHSRHARIKHALGQLAQKHPNYHHDVQRFIQTDRLALFRNRLDWLRLERQKQADNILIICHDRGGGTERHVQDVAQQQLINGRGVFFLRPSVSRPSHLRLNHYSNMNLNSIPDFPLADTAGLSAALERLSISEIHVHGLIDLEKDAPTHIEKLCRTAGLPLYVTIHDYAVCCPRINLIDEKGMYCGEPNENACNRCVLKNGNDFRVSDIATWRQTNHAMLRSARSITVPNETSVPRLLRYFSDLHINVIPHHPEINPKQTIPVPTPGFGKLRVIVIGGINKMKGYDILLACAAAVKRDRLPIEFIVMGFSMDDATLLEQDVIMTGKYKEEDALALLAELKPDMVWLPSVWPETFSYTLSIGLTAGVPIVAFDIGAIANRLRALSLDQYVIPLILSQQPAYLNHQFLNYRETRHVGHHEA